MLLAELREEVVQVGLEALRRGVVHGTAGNMSIRDPETGLIAISPSGMPYPAVTAADVVLVDEHGAVVDGARKPSSERRSTRWSTASGRTSGRSFTPTPITRRW